MRTQSYVASQLILCVYFLKKTFKLKPLAIQQFLNTNQQHEHRDRDSF